MEKVFYRNDYSKDRGFTEALNCGLDNIFAIATVV